MNKALQSLEEIKNTYILADRGNGDFLPQWLRDRLLAPIENALTTLELFRNALRLNTTQTEVGVTRDVEGNVIINYDTTFEFIRKTLDEESRKALRQWVLENACPKEVEVLKIIKEKRVDVYVILCSTKLEDYNCNFSEEFHLTQEEFKLLKEVLGNE